MRTVGLGRGVDDYLLQTHLVRVAADGEEGDVNAVESLGENGTVVEGTVDDLNAVEVREGRLGLLAVTDENADVFASGPEVPHDTRTGPAGRSGNEKRHGIHLSERRRERSARRRRCGIRFALCERRETWFRLVDPGGQDPTPEWHSGWLP